MSRVVTTVRLDGELVSRLEAIEEALQRYRGGQATLHPHEEVMARIAAKLTERS